MSKKEPSEKCGPLDNFPKIHCPFIRQKFDVNHDDFKLHRNALNLRSPEVYLAVDKINPGYEWVFEDEDTIAVEKLDGTNITIFTNNSRLVLVQNRSRFIDHLAVNKETHHLMEGIYWAMSREYMKKDGLQSGELVGPKMQSNPYKLQTHMWYPFEKTTKDLSYRCFHEHDKTYDNLSSWFDEYLISRFHTRLTPPDELSEKIMAEGIVFCNLKRKEEGKVWRAKLRRNMFRWYYDRTVRVSKIPKLDE